MLSSTDPDQVNLEFKLYHVIAILFVCTFVIGNILAIKMAKIWIFTTPAGIVVFPLSYIFSDVLTEVYGFQRARQLVWITILCNLLFVIFSQLAIALPEATGWEDQNLIKKVFDFEPRILLASSVAFFVGDYVNCAFLAKLKLIYQNNFIVGRFIGSTALGVAVDNTIFSIIAFAGLVPLEGLAWIVAGQFMLKITYEACMSPISVKVCKMLKKYEKTDVYDFDTNFTPLSLTVSYSGRNNRY